MARLAVPTPQPCSVTNRIEAESFNRSYLLLATHLGEGVVDVLLCSISSGRGEHNGGQHQETESKLTERKRLIFGILGNERRNDTKNDRRKNRQPVSKRDAASPVSMLFAEAPSSSPR